VISIPCDNPGPSKERELWEKKKKAVGKDDVILPSASRNGSAWPLGSTEGKSAGGKRGRGPWKKGILQLRLGHRPGPKGCGVLGVGQRFEKKGGRGLEGVLSLLEKGTL